MYAYSNLCSCCYLLIHVEWRMACFPCIANMAECPWGLLWTIVTWSGFRSRWKTWWQTTLVAFQMVLVHTLSLFGVSMWLKFQTGHVCFFTFLWLRFLLHNCTLDDPLSLCWNSLFFGFGRSGDLWKLKTIFCPTTINVVHFCTSKKLRGTAWIFAQIAE